MLRQEVYAACYQIRCNYRQHEHRRERTSCGEGGGKGKEKAEARQFDGNRLVLLLMMNIRTLAAQQYRHNRQYLPYGR